MIVVGWAWLDTRFPPDHSIIPLFSWTGDSKYNERLMGQGHDKEMSLTSYHYSQNRLDLGQKTI